MVFKRRDKAPWLTRLTEAFWPRKGWKRAFQYVGKRVQRLQDSPHKIALGFACGAFVSFSPFFGFHFFAAALCAWLVRGNIVASLFGTIVGNPLTFSFIALTAMTIGNVALGRPADAVDVPGAMARIADVLGYLWGMLRTLIGLGGETPVRISEFAHHFGLFWDEIMLPYLVGGVGPGVLCAGVVYVVLRPLVAAYQDRRRARLVARFAQTAAEHRHPRMHKRR